MTDGFSQYYDEAVEPGKRERAHAWATAIGLQDVDGLKPSDYLLATAKRHIEGEISQVEARQLIDEYYETKDGRDLPKATEVDLKDFREFCYAAMGLKNRYLRIGCEYDTTASCVRKITNDNSRQTNKSFPKIYLSINSHGKINENEID